MLSLKDILVFALLVVLLLLVALWALLSGSIELDWSSLYSAFSDKESMEHAVIMNLRLPRLLLAFAVGASLSLSGAILQGVYQNPLVEPFTLGISGGSSLGVALCIMCGWGVSLGGLALPLSGFLGALITIFVVYFLGARRSLGDMNQMLLMGVMISLVCSSLLMFLLSIGTTENLHGIIFWTMGSLEQSNFMLVLLVVTCSLMVFILAHLFVHSLNAMRIGHQQAQHLGVSVSRTVRILFVLTSLLTGVCIAVSGIIGFVGLVIPHLMRKIVGTDYRRLLTATFLGGGIFLITCDVLARTIIAPNELPVGVLTGGIGGVAFIIILSQRGRLWRR